LFAIIFIHTFKVFLKQRNCICYKNLKNKVTKNVSFFNLVSDSHGEMKKKSRAKKSFFQNIFSKTSQMTISLSNKCHRTRDRHYCFRRVVECGATPPRLLLCPHVTALLVTFVWLPGQARVAEDPEVRPTRRINRPLVSFFSPFLHDERRRYGAF